MRRHHRDSLSALLRELAAREKGFATTEIQDYSRRQVSNAATHLRMHGEIFGAKIAHNEYRWFDTEERAKAYEAKHQQRERFSPRSTVKEPWQPPKKNSAPPATQRGAKAWWPKDAQPVITPATKVTICPCRIGERTFRTQTHEDTTL